MALAVPLRCRSCRSSVDQFWIVDPMSSLSSARAEWEAVTSPYPLLHKQSYGQIVEEPFRRYGDAIAWLNWQDDCIITKIESLKPRSGAAGSLLSFLKTLTVKHGIRVYGNPVVYEPTCQLAAASPLLQEELEAWYAKHGFLVGRSVNGVPYIRYPSAGANSRRNVVNLK
jgi:hypothetical protein